MSWEQQKDVILGFLAAGMFGWLVYEFREMRHSIENLNVKLAEWIVRSSGHERRIERLEQGERDR